MSATYAIFLHQKMEKHEKNAEKLRKQLEDTVVGLTHEETAEYVKATTPVAHPESCQCKECQA